MTPFPDLYDLCSCVVVALFAGVVIGVYLQSYTMLHQPPCRGCENNPANYGSKTW